MCIALLSTAHPHYPFILLSNRDEFLHRPTARAHWWEGSNSHVLGGRDLQRAEKGTWLGFTKQGRIAILTNFRDDGVEIRLDKSRGGIVNAYLTVPPDHIEGEDPEQFARRLMTEMGIHDVGGFSLLYGQLKPETGEGGNKSLGQLNILSNRTTDSSQLVKLLGTAGETQGLSNSHFGDRTWPKVVKGEQKLKQAIQRHVSDINVDDEQFIESLFEVLSVDTLPKKPRDEPWHEFSNQLKNSIFIPAVNDEEGIQHAAAQVNGTTPQSKLVTEGVYGTQKQTVIVVDRRGRVNYIERTLFDEQGRAVNKPEQEKRFGFSIAS
ncbi:DUF833 domain-containing protein [Polychaeton citri CBS 116435]|uniref:DUF833 domain-containing protein n=1 Tax=Polychaeton citri CBS 116435 TaxID=1314669 RepID=A0A9P4QD01_9PEZI|nr:DUF833 domain-containing protein [Polychaeton citri CBS 116435]